MFKSLKLKRAARRHGMTVGEYREALAESHKRHARKWELRASGLGNW